MIIYIFFKTCEFILHNKYELIPRLKTTSLKLGLKIILSSLQVQKMF